MRFLWVFVCALGHLSFFAGKPRHVDLPPPDVSKLLAEDANRKDRPPRFAKKIPVAISPVHYGEWKRFGQLSRWSLRISSDDALSLNFGFDRFEMPVGGYLEIRSTDGKRSMGRRFTDRDNESHGQLWTPIIRGSDVILQVVVPTDIRSQLKLRLASVNYGYRGFLDAFSGSCNIDVVCEEGEDWWDQIRSVGMISVDGEGVCTGFLVNNVQQNHKPFFMTAEHCGIDKNSAPSMVVYWNYQNSTCRGPQTSGGSGDGQMEQFSTGSVFRASSDVSDFTLVELDDPVDPEFEVYYAGWNATKKDPPWVVAIHHPDTKEKRISFEYDPVKTTTYIEEEYPGDGSHIMVKDWDVGTTEPGSSGSPLFDPDGRVIGQLHGGYAACGNDYPDWYGRFSISFDDKKKPNAQLKYWLDPENTGVRFLDGMD